MELLGKIISVTTAFMQRELTIPSWELTFSYWQLFLMMIVVDVVLWLLWRFLHG